LRAEGRLWHAEFGRANKAVPVSTSLNVVRQLPTEVPLGATSLRLPTGAILFVRHPTDDDLVRIRELSQSEISPVVAPMDLVKAVYRHNRDTFWGVYLSQDGTEQGAKLIGYYSFLHLNEAGARALERGIFEGLNPDMAHLVAEGGRPVAIYVWGLVARKVARLATALVARALGRVRYSGVPIYGKAATLGGVAAFRHYGFESTRPSGGIGGLYRLDPEVPQSEKPAA
jgi:hypothetical protein